MPDFWSPRTWCAPARTSSRRRRLSPGRQALLTLAHLRNGHPYAQLAAGFGVGTTTANRYITEAADLLAALAPALAAAARTASTKAFVLLDGTLLPIDRVTTDRPRTAPGHDSPCASPPTPPSWSNSSTAALFLSEASRRQPSPSSTAVARPEGAAHERHKEHAVAAPARDTIAPTKKCPSASPPLLETQGTALANRNPSTARRAHHTRGIRRSHLFGHDQDTARFPRARYIPDYICSRESSRW